MNIYSSELPGWFVASGHRTADLFEQASGRHNTTAGDAFIELDEGAIICQRVNIAEAGTYEFCFDLYENTCISSYNNRVKLLIDGQTQDVFIPEGHETFSITLELSAGEHRFDFKSLSCVCREGAGLDNVKLKQKILIETPEDPGVENVTVELLDDTGAVIDTTTTDENGDYKFEGVETGDYQVRFIAPDGSEITYQDVGNDDNIDSDADETTGTTNTITVIGGTDVDNIDAGLKPEKAPEKGSIAGRYFCDENDNDVDDNEPGIEGATVALIKDGTVIATTTTNANGCGSFLTT